MTKRSEQLERALLPCPFCGSEAEKTKYNRVFVNCSLLVCPANGKGVVPERWNTRAGLAATESQWVATSERLPERKEGFEHTEQCLLWYQPTPDATGNYGIGYYHYQSPYEGSKWIDFAHLGREPIAWMPLPAPYASETTEEK